MKLTKKELIDLYLPKAGGGVGRTACLSSDDLARAATAEIGIESRERIASHLASCRHCAEEFRLISPLQSFAEGAAVTLSLERPSMQTPVRSGAPRLSWWRLSNAIAALPLLAAIGLGVWALSMRQEQRQRITRMEKELAQQTETAASALASLEQARRELQAFSGPYLNVPIIQLEPRGYVRDQTGLGPIRIPSGASLFTLVLNIAGQRSYADYDLEILDRAGRPVWSGSGLQKSEYNTFSIVLTKRLLPPGQYAFKLYGSNGNQRVTIEEYLVQVLE